MQRRLLCIDVDYVIWFEVLRNRLMCVVQNQAGWKIFDVAHKSQMIVCCLSIRGLSCANNSPKAEGNIREVCSLAVKTFPVIVGSYG